MEDKNILFIDTLLHHNNATSITLSNLFSKWPKDRLFMIGFAKDAEQSFSEGYNKLFILSRSELNHRFPVNCLKKNQSLSMPIYSLRANKTEFPLRKKIDIKNIILLLYKKMGLQNLILRISISPKLEKWIDKNKPDYFYATLSNIHSIKFALNLIRKYDIPLVIHIMDDWLLTFGQDTIFPNFWNYVINKEFRKLLSKSKLNFSISKYMAIEYKKRYYCDWTYFHNPIDINKFNFARIIFSDLTIKDKIKIAYFGRIGKANDTAINKMAEAVIDINNDGYMNLELHIYSKNNLNLPHYTQKENANIFNHGFISFEEVPIAMQKNDFLLLPLSFNRDDIKFAKYSIPTKLSEYMISGVPIIVLAPEEVALSKFIEENKCAINIKSDDIHIIKNKLIDAAKHYNELSEMVEIARRIAINKFDINEVNKRLNKLLAK